MWSWYVAVVQVFRRPLITDAGRNVPPNAASRLGPHGYHPHYRRYVRTPTQVSSLSSVINHPPHPSPNLTASVPREAATVPHPPEA